MFDVHEMEINLGPQHPSTHGVLRVLLSVDGERIISAKPVIGYLHRGTEKRSRTCRIRSASAHGPHGLRGLGHEQPRFRRDGREADGDHGSDPEARAVAARDPERAAAHLVAPPLARHACHRHRCDDAVLLLLLREREQILDLFENYCGARLTLNCMRIGGMPEDAPAGWLDEIEEFIGKFDAAVDEYESLLTNNRIWKRRTVGIGVISPEEAIEWGVTGPPLRGSGVNWDLRKALPYECYSELDFEVPLGINGDTYDRYLCRMAEMRQSRRILEQCIPLIKAHTGGRHQSEDLARRPSARGRGLSTHRIAER